MAEDPFLTWTQELNSNFRSTLWLEVFCMPGVCCSKGTTEDVARNSQILLWISPKTVHASPQRLKLSVFQIVFPRKRLCMWFHSNHNDYDWSGPLHGGCRWETSTSDTLGHLYASSHMTNKSPHWYYCLNSMHQRQFEKKQLFSVCGWVWVFFVWQTFICFL